VTDQDVISALLTKIGPAYQLPSETLEKAIARLKSGIWQLRALRAQLPSLVLEPYIKEAEAHITEVAHRLAEEFAMPADELIPAAREEQQAATQPAAAPEIPAGAIVVGTKVRWTTTQVTALVLAHIPSPRHSSPPEYETLILTEDGRILTVKPEELISEEAAPAVAAATPTLGPGSRVRIRPTGKTGYVSEVAEDMAIVALDEGGFITVPISDLEPL